MKEHPILMQPESVKAILEGRKTQTRRLIKPQPNLEETLEVGPYLQTEVDKNGDQYAGDEVFGAFTPDGELAWKCPYGPVGDSLWLREIWATEKRIDRFSPSYIGNAGAVPIFYKSTDIKNGFLDRGKWRPSIFMPRWASRITLEITEVRVERVQEITEEDAKAEGIDPNNPWGFFDGYINSFGWLWDLINTKRGYGWDTNPWVWIISFAWGQKLK